MSERENDKPLNDEMLVAYIDGELSDTERAEVEAVINGDRRAAARLDHLARSRLPFREAFEPLLSAAPTEKLDRMLSSIPPASAPKAVFGRRGFLAAAAFVVAGIAVDRTLIGISSRLAKPDESAEWRAVVAEYLALYTSDTLSAPAGDRAAQAKELSVVGAKLGMTLTPETVALPGVDFRRAQVLQYDGKALAQIVYLHPETGPMALCMVMSDAGASPPDAERRRGMNVVYWSNATHAFMLIGHSPIDELQTLADHARGVLPA
ncbi:anti-sigma factor family protein [Rhizobium sp. RAF56]|jgi:anti-sigma factor RsiW|uniref:anti-sigma factor family protein n=1 Tax=Rhizobium sp. RAF56 TaxID=3233062 RepID=UPI003F9C111D